MNRLVKQDGCLITKAYATVSQRVLQCLFSCSMLPETKGYLYVGSLDKPFSAIKVCYTNRFHLASVYLNVDTKRCGFHWRGLAGVPCSTVHALMHFSVTFHGSAFVLRQLNASGMFYIGEGALRLVAVHSYRHLAIRTKRTNPHALPLLPPQISTPIIPFSINPVVTY